MSKNFQIQYEIWPELNQLLANKPWVNATYSSVFSTVNWNPIQEWTIQDIGLKP